MGGLVVFRFHLEKSFLLSANDRRHWADKARRVRFYRQQAYLKGVDYFNLGGRKFARAKVTAAVKLSGKRRFDPANASPTVKAIIDGLTDAGLWEDDNADVVTEVSFRAGDWAQPPYTLTLVIEGEPCD